MAAKMPVSDGCIKRAQSKTLVPVMFIIITFYEIPSYMVYDQLQNFVDHCSRFACMLLAEEDILQPKRSHIENLEFIHSFLHSKSNWLTFLNCWFAVIFNKFYLTKI